MFNILKYVPKLIKWRNWTCQFINNEYLIMEVDMRRNYKEATVFTLKTQSESDFIDTLIKVSNCSKNIALKISQELKNPGISGISLQNNRKDYIIINQSNLRADLQNQPLFK